MTKENTWANSEHYEKVHKYLEEKGVDSTNEYHYVNLLEAKGLKVFRKDLKDWLNSLSAVVSASDFEL